MKRKQTVRTAVSLVLVLLLCFCTMTACRSAGGVKVTEVKSGVTADAIRYYKGTENYPFFVMEKDGAFYLIDHNGAKTADRSFEEILFGEAEPYGDRVVLKTWTSESEMAMITADGRIGEEVAGAFGYGGDDSVTPVWYKGHAAVIYNASDGLIGEYSAAAYKENPPTRCPGTVSLTKASVVAVREVLQSRPCETLENAELAVTYSDKYALMDVESGALITEFVYEFADRVGFVDGLLAVKKDGKWGYVREDGTAVTAFAYETVSDESGMEQVYAPVNGYIAVKKDGKFGLIDTDGKTVTEAQYDDVSQVSGDGYFWYKKDGVWSSAKIET